MLTTAHEHRQINWNAQHQSTLVRILHFEGRQVTLNPQLIGPQICGTSKYMIWKWANHPKHPISPPNDSCIKTARNREAANAAGAVLHPHEQQTNRARKRSKHNQISPPKQLSGKAESTSKSDPIISQTRTQHQTSRRPHKPPAKGRGNRSAGGRGGVAYSCGRSSRRRPSRRRPPAANPPSTGYRKRPAATCNSREI